MLQRVNPVVTGRQLLHGNGSKRKLLNFELWKIYKETTRCLLKKVASVPVSPALLFMLFLAVALVVTIIHW